MIVGQNKFEMGPGRPAMVPDHTSGTCFGKKTLHVLFVAGHIKMPEKHDMPRGRNTVLFWKII